MIIEKAVIADHEILSDIAFKGKAFWGYEIELLNQWKDDLTITQNYIQNNEVYKLLVEAEIVGFFSLLKIKTDVLKLDFLFIHPQYIRKGFGRFLLNTAIEMARSKGFHKIVLDADPNAESFYANFGFTTYALLESSVKDRFLPQMELVFV